MKPNVFTVSQVNRYIKAMLEDDVVLQGLFVEAEISNYTHHASGHMYFTLKDGKAAINAVMFKGYAQGLAFEPNNGLKAVVYGTVSLYEKTGQYQLYVEMMEPAGIGALALAFAQLKEKLEREGLFSPEHKKPIPPFPRVIAIVTSPDGAAVHDIINVAKRRNKGVTLVIAPALVQGDGAAASIAEAIKLVNEWGKADVVIVGRGGGAVEDLWAFNEEVVARAIFQSKIPVISAVGHETDYTIADFVADMRAPTPSAAAELAVFQADALHQRLAAAQSALNRGIGRVGAARDDVDLLMQSMHSAIVRKCRDSQSRLAGVVNLLHQLSPLTVLNRGFALVLDEKQQLIRSIGDIKPGQKLNTRLSGGIVHSEVIAVKDEKYGI